MSLKNGISLEGKVAAWIDVPHNLESEINDRSKRRPVEARRVAQEAYAVVSQHPDFSVGVITFYAAQRDEILSSMSNDLTESDNEGGFRVRDQWHQTRDGRERLRIGTVDAIPRQRVRHRLSFSDPLEPCSGEERGHETEAIWLLAAGKPTLRRDESPAPAVGGRGRLLDGVGCRSRGVCAEPMRIQENL